MTLDDFILNTNKLLDYIWNKITCLWIWKLDDTCWCIFALVNNCHCSLKLQFLFAAPLGVEPIKPTLSYELVVLFFPLTLETHSKNWNLIKRECHKLGWVWWVLREIPKVMVKMVHALMMSFGHYDVKWCVRPFLPLLLLDNTSSFVCFFSKIHLSTLNDILIWQREFIPCLNILN